MTNNLSHTMRKFNRFELKYLISLRAAEKFKQALLAYLVPDEHGDPAGSYYLSSLYYDSPDYLFYWEKVDGIRFRRKLRIRYYDTGDPLTDQTPVFVEIKQRVNRVTQKRRIGLPYQAAVQLCGGQQFPEAAEYELTSQDVAVVDEVADLIWRYNLHPASLVSYSRQALVGTEYDIGLRVTFDTHLMYRVENLSLIDPRGDLLLYPAEWTIVEIKVNERIPYWLTELVAAHNLNLVRISKYCRSIELVQNFPDHARRVVTV